MLMFDLIAALYKYKQNTGGICVVFEHVKRHYF